ncbi:hypothetical protein AAVH_02504 [Aphelenchoides avenae]|nr:hypothetical protein AAVH_02504 [Aphelenchus avenae]
MTDTSGFHFAWLQFYTIGDAIRFVVGLTADQFKPKIMLKADKAELKLWYWRPEYEVNGTRLGPYHY